MEAHITVNGTTLTETESAVVRVSLAALAEGLGLRDDGIALTGRYQAETTYVLSLIQGNKARTQ